MAKNDNLKDFLIDIADAIRAKKGTTDLINPQNFSNEIASIKTEAEVTTGSYLCRVVDYNGTILKQEYHNEGDTFTLPDLPTHDGLIAQGFSSPVDIIDNQVTVSNSDLTFGIIYTTSSGLSEFDITLTKVTGLACTLNMNGTKNWGDGTTNTATSHTYADYGDYTITCDGNTMNTSSNSGVFGQYGSKYNYYLTNIRLSNSVTTITAYAFAYCPSLKSVTIPNSVTHIERNVFYYCYTLSSIAIPNSVTYISGSTFCNNFVLNSATIPNSVTEIPSHAFENCYSLKSITIPNSVTTITAYAFENCYSLKSVTIPNSVTTIPRGAWYSNHAMILYDFSKHTAVPTLSNVEAFSAINQICKIIVPDALYDDWITATNWTTYANYIYKASEV